MHYYVADASIVRDDDSLLGFLESYDDDVFVVVCGTLMGVAANNAVESFSTRD